MPDTTAVVIPEERDDSPRVEVLSEELTYRRDGDTSYFKDLIADAQGDYAARSRLQRHGREITDTLERRDRAAREAKPDDVEFRTNPNTGSGLGGSFAPPLWLVDRFATAPRPRRVFANLVPTFPLPQGVHTVNVPRLTTGLSEQPVGDLAVDPSADAVDASVASNVVTVSGHGDVSIQVVDQSPAGAHLDWAFFKDLTEAYDAQLEAQLINGSGLNGQLLGLLNVTGIGSVTYTAASPTATGMFSSLGQTVAAVGKNRKLPPEAWLLSTSRLAWLGSSEDSQNRPLVITDRDGSGEVDLLSYPIKITDALPATLGAGGNQDAIIACRPSDGLLFESVPHARVHLEVLSGTLQARIQLHCYVAALVGRYPSATAALTGTGLVIQSGF